MHQINSDCFLANCAKNIINLITMQGKKIEVTLFMSVYYCVGKQARLAGGFHWYSIFFSSRNNK